MVTGHSDVVGGLNLTRDELFWLTKYQIDLVQGSKHKQFEQSQDVIKAAIRGYTKVVFNKHLLIMSSLPKVLGLSVRNWTIANHENSYSVISDLVL